MGKFFEELYQRALQATAPKPRSRKSASEPTHGPSNYYKTNNIDASLSAYDTGHTLPATYDKLAKAFGLPVNLSSPSTEARQLGDLFGVPASVETFMWVFTDHAKGVYTIYSEDGRKIKTVFKKNWHVGASDGMRASDFIRWANAKIAGGR